MLITIQPFDIETYDEVLVLWQKSEGVGLSGADSRENIWSYLERNPGLSFVAFHEGRIVGTVLAGHDGRRGYIHHLAVHPEWRRKGIGRRLVDRCLQTLQRAGIQKCHLFIFNDNTGGMDFWKTLGWEHRMDISLMSRNIGQEAEGELAASNSEGGETMNAFPEFMRHPNNRISTETQYTPGIEGYLFDGLDGSQMAIWTYPGGGKSAEHVHDYDEYFTVVQGEYTVIMSGRRIPVGIGEEFLISKGTLHSGEALAGTRAIYAFGGKRAKRVGGDA